VTFFKSETINEAVIEEVKALIDGENLSAIKKLIDGLRPADVADLVEHLDDAERLVIMDLLETEGAGDVLVEVETPIQARILNELDNEAICRIVEKLDSDDAADLVGDLPPERAKEIIEALGKDASEELEKLLPYPEDSAGGIMALEYVAVRTDATVQEAIETLRERGKEVENLYHIWAVDEHERLVGVISLKDLIVASPDQRVTEILNPEVISANVQADQEEVANLVKKYDLVNVPVVDNRNRLVGRITYDDILDVIEEETDEDISFMGGVIDEEFTEESTLRVSRARLPWLVAGLFGGILAAAVISQFQVSLERVLALSFFFPVVMAMGGNTGIQAATVVVRGLSTNEISMIHVGKRLWLEMKVAILNGIICGILLGGVIGVWLSDYQLGFVIAFALVLIITISGLIGSAVPLTLSRLNIDPAIATGPFVTTSNDIFGLLIYLGLVTLFLRVTA